MHPHRIMQRENKAFSTSPSGWATKTLWLLSQQVHNASIPTHIMRNPKWIVK